MTTITLEVPDEVAAQLKAWSESLPELLQEAVMARAASKEHSISKAEAAEPIYQELIDFLTSSPNAEQAIAFKISAAAQERLEDLLDKNREQILLPEERAELNIYLHLSHLVTRMKARGRSGQPLIN